MNALDSLLKCDVPRSRSHQILQKDIDGDLLDLNYNFHLSLTAPPLNLRRKSESLNDSNMEQSLSVQKRNSSSIESSDYLIDIVHI